MAFFRWNGQASAPMQRAVHWILVEKKHSQHAATSTRRRFHAACARKPLCHTASTTEKKPEPKKQRRTQTIFWRRKNHHTHTKDNRVFLTAQALLAHICLQNQYATNCNPNQAQTPKQTPPQTRLVVVEKRGVCGNNLTRNTVI